MSSRRSRLSFLLSASGSGPGENPAGPGHCLGPGRVCQVERELSTGWIRS